MTSVARPHWIRRVLMALGALLGLLLVSAGALALWVHTDSGRSFVARKVERAVNAQIRGAIHLGTISEISLRNIHVRALKFTAPDGSEVLVADEVDVTPRWGALIRGRFVAPFTRVKGARLTLRDNAQGDLSLAETFASPNPSAGAVDTHAPAPVDFERIVMSGVTLVARLQGVPDARMGRIAGAIRVWLPHPGADVRVSAEDLRGSARIDAPLPITIAVTDGTFRFNGAARQRARTDVRGVIDDTRVRVTVNATSERDDSQVSARLFLPSDVGPTNNLPTILQASIAASASPHFDFSVVRD